VGRKEAINYVDIGPKFTIFFAERGSYRSQSNLFPIVDILIRSGDIRDRSLELSEIAPILRPHILRCAGSRKICTQIFTPASWYSTWTSLV